jgi:hypothetical protein
MVAIAAITHEIEHPPPPTRNGFDICDPVLKPM